MYLRNADDRSRKNVIPIGQGDDRIVCKEHKYENG